MKKSDRFGTKEKIHERVDRVQKMFVGTRVGPS